MRTEKDSLGEMEVPDDVYYGIHTARSLKNFNISGEMFPVEIVYNIARIKVACARANSALGILGPEKADVIESACMRILRGDHDNEFCIDVFQAGSGTSTNMNVNEVIANIACEILEGKRGDKSILHPNDHVNVGESTNNIIPTAIRMTAVELSHALLASLKNLHSELKKKESEFSDIIKSGRTHLQDAVPVTLGQEFGAYARAVEKAIVRIAEARQHLYELGIGGNAIGTGVNTKKEFRQLIVQELQTITGENYSVAKNGIELTQFLTDIAQFSGALRLLSIDMLKTVNDFRLLASGPNTGFAEILLPAVEPGSSIMPGKINPSICEAANMACMQVLGYDYATATACAAGQLELNTHMPLVGYNIVKSLHILQRTCDALADKCVNGISANKGVCMQHFEASGGLPTILNPLLGYDKVAELVKESLREKKSLRQLVLEKNIVSEEEFEKLLRQSTGPI